MIRHLLSRRWIGNPVVFAIAALLAASWCAPLARADLKSDDVDAAIAKAIKFVYSQQKPNKTWEEVETPENNGDQGKHDVNGRQWGGLTSMATYALLAANESPQDKRLAGAISFLRTADIRSIYALGLRCQVWLRLRNDKTLRTLILHDRDILLHAMYQDPKLRSDPPLGSIPITWIAGRGLTPGTTTASANTAFWECGRWNRRGGEVPPAYWKIVDGAWRRVATGLMADGHTASLAGAFPRPADR